MLVDLLELGAGYLDAAAGDALRAEGEGNRCFLRVGKAVVALLLFAGGGVRLNERSSCLHGILQVGGGFVCVVRE